MVQPEPEERGRISLFFRLYRARYQATLAALAAEGESRIGGTAHIRRGYEDILRDLRHLGAAAEER